MNQTVQFLLDNATVSQIAEHLQSCDDDFVPTLSSRVGIDAYATKIVTNAARFEAWAGGKLIGLIAAYCNDQDRRMAYVTSVSILKAWHGNGVAQRLVEQCVERTKALGFSEISLEVAADNTTAINLYKKCGFVVNNAIGPVIHMNQYLKSEESMNNVRDYNVEIADTDDHKYAYGFDFDVMHPYMIKSFEPFFNKGSLLELGSFKGDFTRRFLPYFEDVTCVEASDAAIAEAKQKLGSKVTFVNSLFEKASLPKRYNNIVLTHVLEHLDDPVLVLKRINDEWLADGGRFFLVCPNANAPSRQIAVKMGLISHNSAVTPAEAEHGHRCTYTLDTLERDALAAGLKVVHRSGIFFKALANFQWDRLLQTDIISKEYLDGCYKLGQLYPDLCSSIFLMCERGDNK